MGGQAAGGGAGSQRQRLLMGKRGKPGKAKEAASNGGGVAGGSGSAAGGACAPRDDPDCFVCGLPLAAGEEVVHVECTACGACAYHAQCVRKLVFEGSHFFSTDAENASNMSKWRKMRDALLGRVESAKNDPDAVVAQAIRFVMKVRHTPGWVHEGGS